MVNQKNNAKKILHITPHLGGGIGSVVLNWMAKDESGNLHTIISLDKNNNSDWIQVNNERERVTIFDECYNKRDFRELLFSHIENSDIVIIHWWNHPLIYDVMLNYKWPVCRVLIWNHVSSLCPPYSMSEKLVDFTDYLIFTSPVSYECEEIQKLPAGKKAKLDVNWSTVGVESFENLERTPHEGFIVGYTGTVDFGKLNPNFIKLCDAVDIPNVKFVVCSGDSQQHLIDEANKLGISDKFSFEGRVPSVVPYLATYNVFGYPLQPQHFATCEQSIGEAMMAGAVPVVLGNLTEKYIVKHMETGMVAETLEDYPKHIEYLYNNPAELKRMAENAKVFAKKQYDIKQTMVKWENIFDKTMQIEKKERVWDINYRGKYSPAQLYIESIGEKAKPLKDYINAQNNEKKTQSAKSIKELFDTNIMFCSNNKGSAMQYLRFFPEDVILKEWCELTMDKELIW